MARVTTGLHVSFPGTGHCHCLQKLCEPFCGGLSPAAVFAARRDDKFNLSDVMVHRPHKHICKQLLITFLFLPG